MPIPTLFVASSTEGLRIAQQIRSDLERRRRNPSNQDIGKSDTERQRVVIPILWTDSIFRLGDSIPDRIVETAARFDFAVLVFSPDDVVMSRGTKNLAPRDNIVFELGLFAGQLGRERTFAVALDSEKEGLKLPSDFAGVMHATYTIETDENGQKIPSVGSACDDIVQAVERLGKLRLAPPDMEKTLFEIIKNHRTAFRVEHPLFQKYLGRWCANEKEDSEVWKKGLLRVQKDSPFVLLQLFQNSKMNIFSTKLLGSGFKWNEQWEDRLLQAQKENKFAKSTRVFVYPQKRPPEKNDKEIMERYNNAGIEVRVYIDDRNDRIRGEEFIYEAEIESEWHMIDDGEAIGISKDNGADIMEVHWFFADREKAMKYNDLKNNLMLSSYPFNVWASQQP